MPGPSQSSSRWTSSASSSTRPRSDTGDVRVLTDERAIFLVTGVPGAGKSTVAQLLAERFSASAHVRGDVFRRMIVNGRVDPVPALSREGLDQLLLRYRISATVADAYYDAGFTVVLQDVVVGRLLDDFVRLVKGRPLLVVVLAPTREVVAARAATRAKRAYDGGSVDELYDVFEKETPRIGLWIDSSEQEARDTVDEIVARAWREAAV